MSLHYDRAVFQGRLGPAVCDGVGAGLCYIWAGVGLGLVGARSNMHNYKGGSPLHGWDGVR